MTTDPQYLSDQEILSRLQLLLREAASAPGAKQEAGDLVLVLADRIHTQPERWGLGGVPQPLRDEVAQDVLLSLFSQTSTAAGETPTDWFARQSERRFQELWRRKEAAATAPRPQTVPGLDGDSLETESMVDVEGGPWQRFEHEFPRDAFVLRLRYVQKRAPEEMMIMMDAPSVGSIHSRLSRARSRMRMFFEQSAFDKNEVKAVMRQFGDGAAGDEGAE